MKRASPVTAGFGLALFNCNRNSKPKGREDMANAPKPVKSEKPAAGKLQKKQTLKPVAPLLKF